MNTDLNKNFIDYFPSPNQDNKALLDLLNKTSIILCKWFSESENLSPLPKEIQFDCSYPGEVSCDIHILLDEIHKLIYSSFNPSHPGSLAHLDPPPLSISIIGDLISASLNNNLLAQELSPSISLLEDEISKWFCSKIGFNESSGGISASGGTLNNLNALVTARHYAGLDNDQNAAFIISEDAHVSFHKCARIIGLKDENLIKVDTDNEGKMNISSLHELIEKNTVAGKKIFAVIGTFGTTIRGAIDPIKKIGNYCKDKNIWFHIDGSIGGVFSLFNDQIEEINNLKISNSITVNPQKVLGITKTSSLLLVDNIETLKKTFQTGLPYIGSKDDVLNRGELGVQGSRPAEIIKLWLGLKFLGINGVNDILKKSISKKILLENILDKNKFYIYSGSLHIISFFPKFMSQDESNKWTLEAKQALLENNFMISRPFYKDRYILRVVFGNYNTNENHIVELANFLNNYVK